MLVPPRAVSIMSSNDVLFRDIWAQVRPRHRDERQARPQPRL